MLSKCRKVTVEHVLLLDGRRVEAILLEFFQTHAKSPSALSDTLIAPALKEIGDRWERGEAALSQVYMSSRIVEKAIQRVVAPSGHVPPTPVIGLGVLEDYHALGKNFVRTEIKRACKGAMTVMGNLNGVALARWSVEETLAQTRACLEAAWEGGGFILSDNHGEIPSQVPEDNLHAIMEAARSRGPRPPPE